MNTVPFYGYDYGSHKIGATTEAITEDFISVELTHGLSECV